MSPLYLVEGKLLVRDNALATSADCCCTECITIPGDLRDSSRPYNDLTNDRGNGPLCYDPEVSLQYEVFVPDSMSLPKTVNIKAYIDDDLRVTYTDINMAVQVVIVDEGLWTGWGQPPYGDPNLFYDCNPPHDVDYTFVTNERRILIEVVDNFGGLTGHNGITVCFSSQ